MTTGECGKYTHICQERKYNKNETWILDVENWCAHMHTYAYLWSIMNIYPWFPYQVTCDHFAQLCFVEESDNIWQQSFVKLNLPFKWHIIKQRCTISYHIRKHDEPKRRTSLQTALHAVAITSMLHFERHEIVWSPFMPNLLKISQDDIVAALLMSSYYMPCPICLLLAIWLCLDPHGSR